jgi:hypothetical protein
MRVLVACEYSGVVREAFKKKGHDAWSVDILPTEIEGNHIQDDVFTHPALIYQTQVLGFYIQKVS